VLRKLGATALPSTQERPRPVRSNVMPPSGTFLPKPSDNHVGPVSYLAFRHPLFFVSEYVTKYHYCAGELVSLQELVRAGAPLL